MTPPLSATLTSIPDSAVSSILSAAAAAAWGDVIPMAGGEPTFAVIEGAFAAFRSFDERMLTKYSPFAGYPELLDLLRTKLATVNHVTANLNEIIVVPGGAAGLWGAISAVADPGTEIVVTDPCWEHYHSIVRMAGARPVAWSLFNGSFNGPVDFAALESVVTPRTRGVLINTPLNPSGYVFSQSDLQILCEFCERRNIHLICDEEYETFVYGGRRHVSPRTISPAVISLHSMSKGFALTGIRIGYVVARPEVVALIRRAGLYSYMYSSSTAQCLAIAVLRQNYLHYLEAVRQDYERRATTLTNLMTAVDGIDAVPPMGGVYLFPRFPLIEGRNAAHALIRDQHLLCVPGEVAGPSSIDRVRFFFGVPEHFFAQAAERVAATVTALSVGDIGR